MTSAILVRCSTNWAMKPHIRSEVNLLSSNLPWGVKWFGGHGFESRWSPELRWSLFTFIVNYCRKFNNARHNQKRGSRRIKYFFLIWRNYFGKSRLTTSSEITIHEKKASISCFIFFYSLQRHIQTILRYMTIWAVPLLLHYITLLNLLKEIVLTLLLFF